MKALSVLVHAFCAWAACAVLSFAGLKSVGRPAQAALRCLIVCACFWTVFRGYFRSPDRLPAPAAAAIAVGFVAALDLTLLGRYSLHAYDVLLSFWDWQLPAAAAAAAVLAAGRCRS